MWLPPLSTRFPYTTLFRSQRRIRIAGFILRGPDKCLVVMYAIARIFPSVQLADKPCLPLRSRDELRTIKVRILKRVALEHLDRKSTRLNSSHLGISYAVFC